MAVPVELQVTDPVVMSSIKDTTLIHTSQIDPAFAALSLADPLFRKPPGDFARLLARTSSYLAELSPVQFPHALHDRSNYRPKSRY